MYLPMFRYATVVSFDRMDCGHLGAAVGSGDMTGLVRLVDDGTVLSFDYRDWCEPYRYGPSEESEAPFAPWSVRGFKTWLDGNYTYSWPSPGDCLSVLVQDGQVKLWAWPGLVLRADTPSRYQVDGHLIFVCDTAGLLDWQVKERVVADKWYDPGMGVVYVGGVRDAAQWMSDHPLADGASE